MFYTGLLKRVIPFVLTFAAGLLLASFFVSVALPNMGEWRSNRRDRRWREHKQLRQESEDLRQKYFEEVEKNAELRRQIADTDVLLQGAVPPVAVEAPYPPTPPRSRGKGIGYGSGSGR
jgi:uncharacterized protein HemY